MTMPDEAAGAAPEARRAQIEAEIATLRSKYVAHPQRYVYVLMVISMIDGSDRQLISTVFQDIKRAFDVSDAQLGLLTAAYSMLATLSAVPFGFLTDRMNRVKLIALGFIPWSIAQIWSGMANSFTMLFISRLFLGSIEATNGPSTPSLLGDYYPVDRRSRIFGIHGMGNILGATFGLAAGGIAASTFGWRTAFVIWGVMGFITAAMVMRLLPEPQRGIPDALFRAEQKLLALDADEAGGVEVAAVDEPVDGVDYRSLRPRQALATVFRIKTIWIVLLGTSTSMFFTAATTWVPTYYRRYHGMSAGTAGLVIAIVSLFSVAGIFVGSRFGDRFVRAGKPERRLILVTVVQLVAMAGWLVSFSSDATPVAITFLIVGAFASTFPSAILQASLIDVVVPHLRGRASAVQAALRVIATASSPLLFGILSDSMGLRAAWLGVAPTIGVSGLIMLLAIRTYPGDVERARSEASRQTRLELREGTLDTPDTASSLAGAAVLLDQSHEFANEVEELALTVAAGREDAWFPIAGYDRLTVAEILPLLPKLHRDQLAVVAAREHSGKGRRAVLDQLADLTSRSQGAPDDAVVEEWLAGRET